MEVELRLQSSSNAHLKRLLRFSQTIAIEYQLQNPRTIYHQTSKSTISELVEEEFLNPAILKGISLGGQRGCDNLANVLCSVLSERQFVAAQELRIF